MRGKKVFISGGTGSFGQAFLKYVLKHKVMFEYITLYSRDELKHYNLQQKYPVEEYPHFHYIIGDVRDEERLREAMQGHDIVIHAAAMKHVYLCEENPSECIKTNVWGTENLLKIAKDDSKPLQVIFISSDKAVEPINVYGESKQKAEKMFLQMQKEDAKSRYSVIRYGNVYGASGSLVPTIEKQKEEGKIKITDERMKRYFISPEEAIASVLYLLKNQEGGEILVPRCEEVVIVDLAKQIAPKADIQFVGMRNGEKLEEKLMTDQEFQNAVEKDDYYIIK